MERIIKLLGIAGFLVVGFSCFANIKNVPFKLNQVIEYCEYSVWSISPAEPILNVSRDLYFKKVSQDINLIIKTGDSQIGGTLTVPDKHNSSSLVILISGSGDQDRDETLEGFKIFKAIAEHLASRGIASFRYDDRGVGESTGDFVNSTLDDHSNDLEHIMDYFKTTKKYAFSEFILFGHSQGGIVASKVAVSNAHVRKLILMGAPAVPLVEVVLYQVRYEYKDTIICKSLIEANVSAHNRLMRAIKDNKNINEALSFYRESIKSILYESSIPKDVVDTLKIEQEAIGKAEELKVIYGLPSLTSFLYYNPSKDLEKLEVPVLALFGGLDFQVPIHQNKDRMENALLKSETDYHFITFDNANHFFQEAKTGERDEYSKLEKKFVANFLNEISDWIIGNRL